MELVGNKRNELQLRISGYRYPHADQLAQKYSWHMMEGTGSAHRCRWSFRHTALTCDESYEVSTWLRDVAGFPIPETEGCGITAP